MMAIFLLMASLLFAMPVYAKDTENLQITLESRYAAMKTAMANRDAKEIGAILAPDFSSIDREGRVITSDEMISEVVALPKDPAKTSQTTLLKVQQDGDVAVVTQQYDMKTVKKTLGILSRNVELKTLSTDTWVKIGDKWLWKKTVTDKVEYFINGQLAMSK